MIYHRLTVVFTLSKRGLTLKFAHVLYCYIQLSFFLTVYVLVLLMPASVDMRILLCVRVLVSPLQHSKCNLIHVKLCGVVVFIELCPFTSLPVTSTFSQGHNSVKEFTLKADFLGIFLFDQLKASFDCY